MLTRKPICAGAACLAALAAATVSADVTMQQKVDVDAGGFMAMFGVSGTLTTYVSTDRSRTEADMESKSGMLGAFMGNPDSASIVRLDRGLSWQLNPEKQQYTEMTMEQMRAEMAQSAAQLEEMQQQGGGAQALPVSAEECQWSDPIMDIRETGEKQRFANVKAEQHIVTIQETCTVPDTGKSCVVTWELENWMARRMRGEDELKAFHQAMAEALGAEDMMSGVPAASRGLLAMFKEGWEEALDEAGEMRGYPVKTVMQMKMGGESCTMASGQPIAMDDVWSDAMDAGLDAAAAQAGAQAGAAIGQQAAEAMGDSVGGAVGGAAVGAASSEVIGGLLSKFRRRKKEPEPQPEAAESENPAAGSIVLFRISAELTGLSDDRIPADRFEIPAGWEKVN